MTIPFTIQLPTKYGQMLVCRHDVNQTNALFKTGQAIDYKSINTLIRIMRTMPDKTFLDIGANVGTHSLALAKYAKMVYAFEAQRIIYNMLCGSIAINSLLNVRAYNEAVGDSFRDIYVPVLNYHEELQFGGVRFQGEMKPSSELVSQTTIDCFEFDDVGLMKIDVEGMEERVVCGATETIRRCKPIIHIEHLPEDYEKNKGLMPMIVDLGYEVFQNEIDFLCVPKDKVNEILPILDVIAKANGELDE